MNYFYLTIAVVLEVIATSALAASHGFTRPVPSIVTAVGYGVAFYLIESRARLRATFRLQLLLGSACSPASFDRPRIQASTATACPSALQVHGSDVPARGPLSGPKPCARDPGRWPAFRATHVLHTLI